ncbi:hypothetical protein ACWEQ8_12885 [Streptomyces noursei]
MSTEDTTHRWVALDRFPDSPDSEGWVTALGIPFSCRMLGKGVGIRSERGVDGVVFTDAHSSPVQIVRITALGGTRFRTRGRWRG